MERTPFTKEGFERLKKELDTLERVERFKAIWKDLRQSRLLK